MPKYIQPDWSKLPPYISSQDAARLLGVSGATLRTYRKRGQIKPPVERTHNSALYLTEDIRACWLDRDRRAEITYDEPAYVLDAIQPGSSRKSLGSASDTTPTDLLPQAMQAAVRESIQSAIETATAPLSAELSALNSEIADLRSAVSALTQALQEASSETQASKPTFWSKVFTRVK